MSWVTILQNLYQQVPQKAEPLAAFSRVEKSLQKHLGFSSALLLLRHETGLPTVGGNRPLAPSEEREMTRRFHRALKPWKAQGAARKGAWERFWPVVVGKEWVACYAMGSKSSGLAITEDEEKVIELLADRTALFLEERRLWKHLENADRQASLGFMSAAMVHEIRNPLTALDTLVQLLPRKRKDEQFMDSFQTLMQKEIHRLTKLTETFLNFSKSTLENRGEVDLRRVIERVVQLLGPLFATKKVQLMVDTTLSPLLEGDEHQLESLVMNLLQNAFRSVGNGGMVEISTGFLKKAGSGPGSWIVLQVKDNGEGIPKENLGKIFNPFFTTRGEGTGLGLAICQKIVEHHRGRLEVKSVPKRETVFRVLFPTVPGP